MPQAGFPALVLAGGLTDIDQTLAVSVLILFAIFAFVLGRFGWKPLLHVIDEREKGIREAVEGADKANAEAQRLLAQHHELVREATRERDDILKRALGEAEALKNDIVGKARAEAEQAAERARQQIERDKSQAIQELKSQVADIAIEAASKIVQSSLTPEAQRRLVSEFIEQLPKAH